MSRVLGMDPAETGAAATRRREDPDWYLGPSARSATTGIVVGGASRSGTTLLRVMLDTHPDIACGPESYLFCATLKEGVLARKFDVTKEQIRTWEAESDSFPRFVELFLEEHARRQGARYWAEKTPRNVLNVGWILDRFHNVTFCHMVRDGRAVVNSLRTHPRYRVVDGRLVRTGIVRDLDRCIDRWLRMVRTGLEFSGHPRVVELRYEDLVDDPATTAGPLLSRFGLQWMPEMARFNEVETPSRDVTRFPQNPEATRPIDRSATDRWRTELSADDVARIEHRGGHVLERFGYL